MTDLDEEKPRTMRMFCEEYHVHDPHPWSEVGTVHCPGYTPDSPPETDEK